MSFTHYSVDTGIEASQAFWTQDSVADHVELCDYETTLPVFLRCLPKGEAILDAGCGLARWVIYLRYRGYKVFGVDSAHRALSQARRFEESTPLFGGGTTHLPLAPGRKRWELNLCGKILHGIANRISPWLVAGGVLAVARRK